MNDSDLLLDHIKAPYHHGRLPDATHANRQNNPLCGDEIELQLLIDDEQYIRQAWFDGLGCALSQGAASLLCEMIEGRTASELSRWDAVEFVQHLGVKLSPIRMQCALLGFNAIQAILREQPVRESQS